MRLVIASNNEHKITEIKEILGNFFSSVLSMSEAGIFIEVEEDGNTFEENAMKKAVEIQKLLPDCAVLSDDSGLCVDALDGAPGIHSARYSGEGHDDKANNDKLLREIHDVAEKDRGAHFASCIVLLRPEQEDICVVGYCHGEIGYSEIGDNGFGYDPLFFPDNMDISFAQLTSHEKNIISHRANSLKKLKEVLNRE